MKNLGSNVAWKVRKTKNGAEFFLFVPQETKGTCGEGRKEDKVVVEKKVQTTENAYRRLFGN